MQRVMLRDNEMDSSGRSDEETIQDVYDSMTDKQKEVLHYMLGQALEGMLAQST